MKKEIKFSAKLDSAEFDRSVEQMQRKLKDIYAPADAIRQQSQTAGRMESMGIPGASKPTQEAFQRATQQSRREVDQFLTSEVKRQEALSKTIAQRLEKVQQLRKEQESLVKGSEEELKIKEKIARMESNNSRLRDIERGRQQAINQTMDVRDRLTPGGFDKLKEGFQNGGIRGAAQAGADHLKSMSASQIAGVIGTILTTTGIAMKIGGELYRDYKQAPINTASNYGSATTGVFGREVNAAYSGKSALEMAFLPEKQKAMKMAQESMKGERTANGLGLLGSVLGYAGAGAAGGGAYGATAGALAGMGVLSLPGAGIGATGGAILGGIGGAGYGLYKGMTGEGGAKNSALAKGLVSGTHDAEYESMMAKDFADKYGQALQGVKEQNPFKVASAEQYDANYMRYLNTQRSMGLNNQQFHGANGFRSGAINAGFTDDMAMGASSGILSANGSTSMAKDSVFALQASRNFNQTNSTNVLGQLSGQLGSSESSKQAYVKMLAEGTRIGLDTSTYAEESRKMMEATAGVITKSGASSSTDIDRIVSQMGGFLAEKTNKGIQSAKEAFEFYNQASGEVGGPRGVLRASGFMKDPLLGKMSAFERSSLASMSSDQLSTDDPMLKGLASKYGTTPDEIIKNIGSVNKNSMNFRKGTDDAQKKAADLKQQIDSLSPGDPKRAELQAQFDQAFGEYNQGVANDFPTMTSKARIAFTTGGITPGADMQKLMEDAQKTSKEMDNKNTGRIEDRSVEGAAEGSRVVLDNFMKFKDQLVPTADAIREFNKQIAETVTIIDRMSPNDRAKYMEKMGFGKPEVQSQSGKSSR